MSTFRIAVLSDIHAYDRDSDDSYILTEPPIALRGQHPFRDLLPLIRNRAIRADLVVSPGDITNRASHGGAQYAWGLLHQIATELRASSVVATPGNHDLETHSPSPHPREALQQLRPSFPSGDPAADDQFWRDGFALDDSHADIRVLNLDSCIGFPAHPGTSATDAQIEDYKQAIDRGSFTPAVQASVERALAGRSEKKVNIALCHHHPVEHQNLALFQDTYGPMHRGGDLIQMLSDQVHTGRWMVIHGHKHVPLLTIAGASSNAPILFCAASLGGKLWPPVNTVTRNQFHIIEFELDSTAGLPDTRGTITSYMWGFGKGWVPAQPMSGLPYTAGFGMTNDYRDLARQSIQSLTSRGRQFERWSDLLADLPALRYQNPVDMALYETELGSRGYVLERNQDGAITTVSKEL